MCKSMCDSSKVLGNPCWFAIEYAANYDFQDVLQYRLISINQVLKPTPESRQSSSIKFLRRIRPLFIILALVWIRIKKGCKFSNASSGADLAQSHMASFLFILGNTVAPKGH